MQVRAAGRDPFLSRLNHCGVGACRAGLRTEVATFDAAVEARAAEHREAVLAAKALKAAERVQKRAERRAATDVKRKLERDTTALRKSQAGAKLGRAQLALRARREQWLDNVEAEALRTWIPEDKVRVGGGGADARPLPPPMRMHPPPQIDSMITPDLFAAKLTWQYQTYFAAQDERRTLEEAARCVGEWEAVRRCAH